MIWFKRPSRARLTTSPQRIVTWQLGGGLSEYLVVAADEVEPIPAGLDFTSAAAMLVDYQTAHYALFELRVVRLMRSVVLSAREEPYVEGAVTSGTRPLTILYRHILPNTTSPILVQATYIFASAMIAEAALSFIGAGIPPEVPSWGNIMSEARSVWQIRPYIVFIPAAFLSVAVSIGASRRPLSIVAPISIASSSQWSQGWLLPRGTGLRVDSTHLCRRGNRSRVPGAVHNACSCSAGWRSTSA